MSRANSYLKFVYYIIYTKIFISVKSSKMIKNVGKLPNNNVKK